MRLTELGPRWLAQEGRLGQGITFRCPVHSRPEDGDAIWGEVPCDHPRVGVSFSQPLDGDAPIPGEGARWDRTGDSFETLTITPSINVVGGHWHGFVTTGEVTTL